MDFEQYFKSPTRSRSIHHFRDIYFQDQEHACFAAAALNSSLFFFWFISIGNGRNITGTDVEAFPIGHPAPGALRDASAAFRRLMDDYKENSLIRQRADCEFQEFRPNLSKHIMDVIDQILATHFEFADEELDFILNYDIKYRMGLSDAEDIESDGDGAEEGKV